MPRISLTPRFFDWAARDTLVVTEHNTLTIQADATRLPDHLDLSIDGLPGGSRVTAAEVALPDGVELAAEPDLVLVAVTVAPTAEEMEAEVAGEAPAAVEPTEAEEAPAEA